MAPLTAVVVDNNNLFVRFFTQLLADHYADLLEVRAVCSTSEAIARCAALEPQIILLDRGLPGMTNLPLLAPLRQVAPQAIVIVISIEDEWPYVAAARRAGAAALLNKCTLNTTLRPTIRELCQHH
jgi:DNA-binding NarL/FixJ family response regulator